MDPSELVGAVQTLTGSVDELAKRIDVQQKLIDRIERQRRGLHTTRIALVGVIALVFAVGFLYIRVDSTTHEVQAVQERTSAEILCPLYQVFATSIKVNPPNPNLTPEQARARQNAADTILAGLDKLGCA